MMKDGALTSFALYDPYRRNMFMSEIRSRTDYRNTRKVEI